MIKPIIKTATKLLNRRDVKSTIIIAIAVISGTGLSPDMYPFRELGVTNIKVDAMGAIVLAENDTVDHVKRVHTFMRIKRGKVQQMQTELLMTRAKVHQSGQTK